MKRIDIVIPTRNRPAKLLRMLMSIPTTAAGVDVYVSVVCDGDAETAAALSELIEKSPPDGAVIRTPTAGAGSDERVQERPMSAPPLAIRGAVSVVFVPEHGGSIYCRNLEIAKCSDAVLPATDDISFLPGALESAVESMRSHFPDDDGVVGFTVDGAGGRKQCRAGVALVGRTYLSRFPGRQLYFPGYYHFGAQELARGADSIGKLYFDPGARFIHYHPSRFEDEMDETHVEGHLHKVADRKLSRERELGGKIWGIRL